MREHPHRVVFPDPHRQLPETKPLGILTPRVAGAGEANGRPAASGTTYSTATSFRRVSPGTSAYRSISGFAGSKVLSSSDALNQWNPSPAS